MSNYFRERAGLLTAPYESGMLDNARGRHLSGIAKYSLLFLLLKNSSLFLHVNILLELIFVDLYQCLVFSMVGGNQRKGNAGLLFLPRRLGRECMEHSLC